MQKSVENDGCNFEMRLLTKAFGKVPFCFKRPRHAGIHHQKNDCHLLVFCLHAMKKETQSIYIGTSFETWQHANSSKAFPFERNRNNIFA